VDKGPDAFRTISEVGEELDVPQHVLRFWETRFSQIKPLKRGGGRRYYRPDDVDLLRGIRHLLYGEGYTIKGVQRILKQEGVRFVQQVGQEPSRLAALAPHRDYAEDAEEEQDDAEILQSGRAAPAAQQAAAPAAEPNWSLRPQPAQNGVGHADDWADEAEPQQMGYEQQRADGRHSFAGLQAPLSPAAVERLSEVLEELRECRRLIALARGVVEEDG
jgi:DNA-binding transcriptional MerR regulator